MALPSHPPVEGTRARTPPDTICYGLTLARAGVIRYPFIPSYPPAFPDVQSRALTTRPAGSPSRRSGLPAAPRPPSIVRAPMIRSLSQRTRRPAAAAVLLAGLAACQDQATSVDGPTRRPPPSADGIVSVLTCRASVADKTVSCMDDASYTASLAVQAGGKPTLDTNVGGQGIYVRLASSNLTVAAGVASFNVTVQNLSDAAMATQDGSTRDLKGVRIFFFDGPTATGGSGTVSVSNPSGTDDFTGADQPFFRYGGTVEGTDQPELGADGILSTGEVSTAKNWQLAVDPGVTSFAFRVYVNAEMATQEFASVAPQVTGASAATLVPGQSVTLTGTNFDATPANNAVTIGGVAATVTAATTTSLTVTVPCTKSGIVPVQATRAGMSGVPYGRNLLAPQKTLAVGEAVFVTNTAEVGCTEIMPSGVDSRYVMAVYSAATTATTTTGVQISGDATGEEPAALQDRSPSTLVGPALSLSGAERTADQRHLDLLEKNAEAYKQLRARFPNEGRRGGARRSTVNADPVEPPLTRNFHVSNILSSNICKNYYSVDATRVYYGGKIAIYEDNATPTGLRAANNASMAAYYQKIGDQYNADMEPVLQANFGDPLRRDAETDNNGVVVALFTPVINTNFSGVAGFVVSCDQFPNDDPATPPASTTNNVSTGTNGASNYGQVFYGYQPTNTSTGYTTGTADQWYRTIRSTFIHETKHVISQSARVVNGASSYEASWLEEGTARHSEELWARNAVYNMAWKGNNGYGSAADPKNLYCDVRPTTFAECDANTRGPVSIMQRHFTSLYTNLYGTNARLLSPFGATASDNASYWYATSWSLVRYTIDRYGTSDGDFLKALTESTTSGVTNLAARAGQPIDRLLGGWALSLAVDDYPGLASPSADIQMPTWNFRSIYAGLNADFPGTYTLAYPAIPTTVSMGTFSPVNTTTMYGGGILWYQFAGVHTQPQLVRLRGNNGAALSTNVRLAITRVQ